MNSPSPNPEPRAGTFDVAVETCSVSLLPVDHHERRLYSITLKRRPGERWVVCRLGDYLSASGVWSYGTDATQEWCAAHWHTWEDAVRLASERAALIEVNGRKVDYYLEKL